MEVAEHAWDGHVAVAASRLPGLAVAAAGRDVSVGGRRDGVMWPAHTGWPRRLRLVVLQRVLLDWHHGGGEGVGQVFFGGEGEQENLIKYVWLVNTTSYKFRLSKKNRYHIYIRPNNNKTS